MIDPPTIEFRARSISLLLGAFQALVLATLLAGTRRNATANRLLAALLLVMVLRITPYIIGFAGFYDAYPWLTFAPFELTLAIGPLVYLYVRRLTDGPLPRRWAVHLLAPAVQLGYYAGAFSLPLQTKWAWNDAVHEPWLMPLETAAALLSFGGYLAASWRRYRGYQRWLDENLSNREELRLGWMRGFLLACGGLLVLWTAYACTEWFIRRLTYLDRFPLYLALAVLVYALALAGWRHAGLAYPLPRDWDAVHSADADGIDAGSADTHLARSDRAPAAPGAADRADAAMVDVTPVDADTDAFGADALPPALAAIAPIAPDLTPADKDERATEDDAASSTYAELGAGWSERVRQAQWWREESLTLAVLARRLHTSPRTLSRALNEGLGQSFNELINRMRVEAVAAELADPDGRGDVLRAAFDAGFSSKASFNRAFKAYTGVTPSAYRRQPPDARLNIRQSSAPAEIATHDAAD
ncbi:helix-turn-helix domain-containing protein [Longimicrobium sp.]|uniref:AraC family transcriptional regulator n=1 Tax=Longimicrobium sp. TaxID=2029185 RepID=UPI002E336C80|nr:helix-turn-helix domain-containing protein [Longimicrobium sp.]HEX6039311.1 helix-turn-helix domain-containing protein [Longimicrobium sp.]